MLKVSPFFSKRRSKSADNVKIVIDFVGEQDDHPSGHDDRDDPPDILMTSSSPSPSPSLQRSNHHHHHHHHHQNYPQTTLPLGTRNITMLAAPRNSLQEESHSSLLKAVDHHPAHNGPRRKSFDVAASSSSSSSASAEPERRHSVFGSLMNRINLPNMMLSSSGSRRNTLPRRKKSDQKSSGSNKNTWSKSAAARLSPLMGKKSISDPAGSQIPSGPNNVNTQSSLPAGGSLAGSQMLSSHGEEASSTATISGAGGSVDDAVAMPVGPSNGPDNGSDTGTDEVDSGEGSSRTKQAIESLQIKIHRTREAIKKEQATKEAIVNEYLLMASEKTPTPRIKALFEKKNQKSAQNINQLQRKLETYQVRLQEVETHGYTGHKQAKEVLRDVGQGLKDVMEGVKKGATDTIVSKPKEFAHLIKNKFGSADNIAQLKDPSDTSQSGKPDSTELEDGGTDGEGKTGGTLPASFKYGSDDENSSITSGSGLGGIHGSPHSAQNLGNLTSVNLTPALLAPINEGLLGVRETNKKTNEVLQQLAEEFEEYKNQMQSEVTMLRGYLEDEKFRVERLEEQLNDLTELHQHEMHNLRQDLASTGEKIEYRLDERTTDLSDLVDNTSTRISRLEQQQQQQQILSMEMVENATFRTIISKLINVVLALLAVLLVFVSTAAHFLSPFIHSRSRLAISVVVAVISWLLYSNYYYIQSAASSFTQLFSTTSS